MAERILTLPAHIFRRLTTPAVVGAVGALLMTAFTYLRHRARRPNVTRMSDDWLRTHDRDAGRFDQWRGFDNW